MPRRSNGGDRGSSYDRHQRKLWLLGAIEDTGTRTRKPLGYAPFGGDGKTVECVHGCGTRLTFESLTIDRVLPGKQGGTYVRTNIQPSCLSCNAARGDMTMEEFAKVRATGRH